MDSFNDREKSTTFRGFKNTFKKFNCLHGFRKSKASSESKMEFNHFITNPGLYYVTEQILLNLDSQSLANCRLVSKSLNNFIDNSKPLYNKVEERSSMKAEIWKLNSKKISDNDDGPDGLFDPHLLKKYNKLNEKYLKILQERLNNQDLKSIVKFMKNHWIQVKLWFICYEPINEYELNLFQLACWKNQVEIVKIFIKALTQKELCEVIQTNIFGEIRLKYLMLHFDTFKTIIEYLIQNGICVNMNMFDEKGSTPLHYACYWGKIEVVKLLIAYHEAANETKIWLKSRDNDYMSPINIAWDNKERTGWTEVYDFLDRKINPQKFEGKKSKRLRR